MLYSWQIVKGLPVAVNSLIGAGDVIGKAICVADCGLRVAVDVDGVVVYWKLADMRIPFEDTCISGVPARYVEKIYLPILMRIGAFGKELTLQTRVVGTGDAEYWNTSLDGRTAEDLAASTEHLVWSIRLPRVDNRHFPLSEENRAKLATAIKTLISRI